MKIPLNNITIGPRQRVDLGDLEELKTSLLKHGQIHNVGVRPLPDGKFLLIFGRRRLEAAKLLNWDAIEATVRENLTELDEQLLEFEEDYQRKDRTWQEGCLAIRKVHQYYMRALKRGDIEEWSTRALARVTGHSNMSLNYMLRVAEALMTPERDDEIWNASGWRNAVEIILKRQLQEIDAEMEARKPPPVVVPISIVSEEAPFAESGTLSVPDGEKITIRVHGKPFAFRDLRDKDQRGGASLILSYNPSFPEELMSLALPYLREGGYLLTWSNIPVYHNGPEYELMPYAVLWHKIHVTPCPWPYCCNVTTGLLHRKGRPQGKDFDVPAPCVISAVEDEDPSTLPIAVVEHSLRCIGENVAVVVPCGVNPVYIAELGHVPIWYEPDPEKFQQKFNSLKEHYERTIPNCEVILQPYE